MERQVDLTVPRANEIFKGARKTFGIPRAQHISDGLRGTKRRLLNHDPSIPCLLQEWQRERASAYPIPVGRASRS
jgi:hypothetical protein